METDYLIVGAGFYGAVLAERISRVLKKKVLILEKRDHIGGNCFSEVDEETGIEFHKYGTHIFHTNSEKVFHYLKQFTEFNSYYHQVLTTYDGKVYQMPINLETINSFYGVNLRPFEVEDFLSKEKSKETYKDPKNLEEKAISLVGRPLYEAFIKGYTQKQWQKDPKDLPATIINRLPIRSNYNESYFNNGRFQGIPLDGYTAIFKKMLDHPLIEVKTDTDYFDLKDDITVKEKTFYSGPLDRFFNYKHGKLEWRSVRFEREVSPYEDFQGTSVMNYADVNEPYTRIHEPRHLHPERAYSKDKSLLFYEYSQEDPEAPFYPINTSDNLKIRKLYLEMAKEEEEKNGIIFGGRLGTYAYYDMDQVIGQALATFEGL